MYNIEFLKRGGWNSVVKWIFCFFIGVCTACCGIFIDFGVQKMTEAKLSMFYEAVEREREHEASRGSAALGLIGLNVAMVLTASCFVVFGEPMAAGSGIPEIKTMLNGVKVPNAVSLKCLVCKVVGILFSVSGGLPCGKEGPMIHAGAILGAGIPSGKSSQWGFDLSFKHFQVGATAPTMQAPPLTRSPLPRKVFRSDKDQRDFMACGAAAGVAAAFGAPVGGVLFALEEGATHWHHGLTWKTFMTAMFSTVTLNLLLTANAFGQASRPPSPPHPKSDTNARPRRPATSLCWAARQARSASATSAAPSRR